MNARDRRALIWGAVLIGVAVLYRFALSPLVDEWQAARDTVATQSEMLAQYEDKLEKRGDIRKRLEQRYGPGVNRSLPTADEARVAFPNSVQQAIGRGGAQATQVEVQGFRRVREYPEMELLSLRVQVRCDPNAIPGMLAELTRADMPVVVESVNLSMPQRGQRQQWEATLLVSTPTLKGGRAS